jgi:hypothetical protein
LTAVKNPAGDRDNKKIPNEGAMTITRRVLSGIEPSELPVRRRSEFIMRFNCTEGDP